jgi:HK97 family phage portal protein
MPLIPDALARLRARLATSWPPLARHAPPAAKASRVGPLLAYGTLHEPVWSPRDYAAFAREGFMQNAVCYRSVRMIAEAAASIPLLLYKGDTELENHPLLALLARPSHDQTSRDFLEAWYGYLLVAGNAYVEAVAVGGEIRELHALRPDRMQVVPGPDGWPEAYDYTVAGLKVRFAAEPLAGVRPILHTRLFHPQSDHYGMSPIEAAATAIDIHNAASGWNKALLDNSARPSGALVYAAKDGHLTGEQFERLKAELETGFQGARNAGRPLLLEGGLDWKPLSLSPKDMDFIEAKHAAAREIALALGVPPMLLGIPGDNTFSNYQEANRTLWRQTVLPLVNRACQAFSSWLSPAYGEAALRLVPDLDQVEALSPERDSLWARLDKATFLTLNEKRLAAGYPALDGGDALKSAAPALKYSADQPRLPAGQSGGGQWTSGEGGEGERIAGAGEGAYDPSKPGWHDYTTGANLVCPADLQCTAEEMADQMSRFAVPGQDPSMPVEDGNTYFVTDPRTGFPAGWVDTTVSADGLTIVNTTTAAHVFYDGRIERQASRAADGSWFVSTRGIGNNVIPGMAEINQRQGPLIFNELDRLLRQNIERHHGR